MALAMPVLKGLFRPRDSVVLDRILYSEKMCGLRLLMKSARERPDTDIRPRHMFPTVELPDVESFFRFDPDIWIDDYIRGHPDDVRRIRDAVLDEWDARLLFEAKRDALCMELVDLSGISVDRNHYVEIERNAMRELIPPSFHLSSELYVSWRIPGEGQGYFKGKGYDIMSFDERFPRRPRLYDEWLKFDGQLKQQALARSMYRCSCCHEGTADGASLVVRHVRPVGDGGKSELANVRVVCEECLEYEGFWWH